ncbi:unnamed protein product [Ixodes hexagonus]
MGGGDLNLKKSWHPSTLRNIERVWKAEQMRDQERAKIEQLQKELEEERSKQEMRQYAENKGVVKKRQERLDWMYQGVAGLVDRDQYLLGRKVDKNFEMLKKEEEGVKEENPDQQPGALFTVATTSATVDLENKIREDPLFAIKKQEMKTKKTLLSNPVKMKHLRDMIERSLEKKKKKKKKKRKKERRSSSSSPDSSPRRKHKKHSEAKTRHVESSDEEVEEKRPKAVHTPHGFGLLVSCAVLGEKNQHFVMPPALQGKTLETTEILEEIQASWRTFSIVRSLRSRDCILRCPLFVSCGDHRSRTLHPGGAASSISPLSGGFPFDPQTIGVSLIGHLPPPPRRPNKTNGCRGNPYVITVTNPHPRRNIMPWNDPLPRPKPNRERYTVISVFGLTVRGKQPSERPRQEPPPRPIQRQEKPQSPPHRHSRRRPLSEREKEEARRQMMDNAQWRDEQRKTIISQCDRNETRKSSTGHGFLRQAADTGSVHGRIKQKMNRVQRGSDAMDVHFARK